MQLVGLDKPEQKVIWNSIKDFVREKMDALGLGVKVTVNDRTKLITWESKNQTRKQKACQELKKQFPFLRGSVSNWICEWFFARRSYTKHSEMRRTASSKQYKMEMQKEKQKHLRLAREQAQRASQYQGERHEEQWRARSRRPQSRRTPEQAGHGDRSSLSSLSSLSSHIADTPLRSAVSSRQDGNK
ncbi:hypothetical protein SAICODRAFT_8947 [Saitoella complicata NRRL Y-17804]|nr:uncharacterized protein SAICODRAFT_8947 [Saitoella complicata NRRL Y-17804]ODQ51655.1 hypothetical protein SAICODRAFT_8947 [Saitoella complicata NRRL Y-17804]